MLLIAMQSSLAALLCAALAFVAFAACRLLLDELIDAARHRSLAQGGGTLLTGAPGPRRHLHRIIAS
jgi:hypothetical protein